MFANGLPSRGARVARVIFTVAGIYGILAMAPQYFAEASIASDYPPAITHPEYFYGFIGIALVWQLVFLLIAKDPIRYRLLMPCGVLEKLSFGIPAILLYVQGRLAGVVLCFGLIDLILGILFTTAFFLTTDLAGE